MNSLAIIITVGVVLVAALVGAAFGLGVLLGTKLRARLDGFDGSILREPQMDMEDGDETFTS